MLSLRAGPLTPLFLCVLGYVNEQGYRCAGTLIDPQWLVTAAHCLVDMATLQPSEGVYMVIGELSL